LLTCCCYSPICCWWWCCRRFWAFVVVVTPPPLLHTHTCTLSHRHAFSHAPYYHTRLLRYYTTTATLQGLLLPPHHTLRLRTTSHATTPHTPFPVWFRIYCTYFAVLPFAVRFTPVRGYATPPRVCHTRLNTPAAAAFVGFALPHASCAWIFAFPRTDPACLPDTPQHSYAQHIRATASAFAAFSRTACTHAMRTSRYKQTHARYLAPAAAACNGTLLHSTLPLPTHLQASTALHCACVKRFAPRGTALQPRSHYLHALFAARFRYSAARRLCRT